MATAELIDQQARLIGRIGRARNVSVLREVEALLDEKLPDDFYELTQEEKEALRRGEEDYRNGRWITQEELQDKIVQWRKETRK